MRGATRVAGVLMLVVPSIALSASAAGGSSAATAANRVTYVDEKAEDPGSPDITTVVISNDDTGRITFRVNTRSHPRLTQGMRFRISLIGAGIDYVVEVDPLHPDGSGPSGYAAYAGLLRCQPSADGKVCHHEIPPSFRFSYAGGVRVSFDVAELGLRLSRGESAQFKVAVNTSAGIRLIPNGGYDFTDSHSDRAPSREGAYWTYTLQIGAPPRLVVKSFSATPERPRAGESFTVRLKATRSDTGAVLPNGDVTCSARIAGAAPLARSQHFVRGQAVCAFDIPESARGKTIRGSVSVAYAGKRATRAFARKIA